MGIEGATSVKYYFGFWHITSRMQAGGLPNDDRLFSDCWPASF